MFNAYFIDLLTTFCFQFATVFREKVVTIPFIRCRQVKTQRKPNLILTHGTMKVGFSTRTRCCYMEGCCSMLFVTFLGGLLHYRPCIGKSSSTNQFFDHNCCRSMYRYTSSWCHKLLSPRIQSRSTLETCDATKK